MERYQSYHNRKTLSAHADSKKEEEECKKDELGSRC